MKMQRVLKAIGPIATFLAVGATEALGQTSSTWMGQTSGSWKVNSNWNTPPVSGPNNLFFGGTPTYTDVNQDTGSNFFFNRLQFQADAANGYALSGGSLQVTGAGGTTNANIAVLNPATGQGVLINNAITFATTDSNPVTINLLNTITPTGFTGPAYFDLVLGGTLTGSSTISKFSAGSGTAILAITSSNNNLTGTLNQSGLTFLIGNNALGMKSYLNTGTTTGSAQFSNVVEFGAAAGSAGKETTIGVSDVGSFQEIGSVNGTGGLQLGTVNVASYGLIGFNNTNDTLAGRIEASNAGSHLAKVGTGTLSLTYTSASFLAGLSVRGGGLTLSGGGSTGGALNGLNSTSPITVYGGGTLLLDNNAAGNLTSGDRITDTIPISLNGGAFSMNGDGGNNSGTAAPSAETVGSLTAGAGQSTVSLVSNASGAALTFNSGASANGGTAFITGDNLGTAAPPVSPAKAAVTNVLFASNSTITVGGGGAAGTQTISIIPWAFGSTTNSAIDSFVGYFANSGVRPLTSSEYSSTFSGTTTGVTFNVKLVGDATLTQPTIANSLVIATGLTNLTLGSYSLTLTSGALLSTSTGNPTIGGTLSTGSIMFGFSGNSTAYITDTGALGIASAIIAGSLSKSGGGTLTLSAAVQLSATSALVAVNAGTLAIAAGGSFSVPSNSTLTYQVINPATLDVTSAPLTLGANQLLRGNGNVVGTVMVGNGGTISPSSLGGPDATLASPGTLNVANLNLASGSTYTWTTNSVNASAYTSSELTGTALVLPALGTVTLKITSLLPSNSAGALKDFNPAQSASWTIASFTTVTGYTASSIALDYSAFQNTYTGTFSVSHPNDTDLVLTYTAPVPEPTGLLLLGAAAFSGAGICRRMRNK